MNTNLKSLKIAFVFVKRVRWDDDDDEDRKKREIRFNIELATNARENADN